MALALKPELPPIAADANGVVRVSGTRVTLDSVVIAFNAGCSPEEIALEYESLPLEDVYLVLGYYLRNREDVDGYLRARTQQADAVQAGARPAWSEVRARLIARQRASGAAPGGR